MTRKDDPTTTAVRAAIESDAQYGAIVPPLHLSSNFAFEALGQRGRYDYTRSGNPTRDALTEALAQLEGAAGGVVTSSGMAALTVICHLLEPRDLLVAPHDCYGGTYRLLESLARKGHFELAFVDQADEQALGSVCARRPMLILCETPSNPLLRIVDIEAIAALAKASDALLVVDNTFLSPALQQPISLGADIVIHSTTKYINGHSDVVGGAALAAHEALADSLTWWANCLGLTGAPFDSYLTLRGLRTLHARIGQHEKNAMTLATMLNKHAAVDRVYYPGLASHPGHEIALRQQQGFGGMISFDIAGGEAAAAAFVSTLRHFSLAESLGGVESLVCHPASMTHAPLSSEAQQAAGIGPGLVRLSVGLECADDLVGDCLRGLEAAREIAAAAGMAAA